MKTLFFLLSYLFIFSCQQATNKVESNPVTIPSHLADSFSLHLQQLCDKSIIPGFGVAIVKDREVVYEKGFGYADLQGGQAFTTHTINFIASIAKTTIGWSVAKLVEEGQLDLNEPINDILPYPVVNPHFPQNPILVKHLVHHTSTIVDDFDPEDVGEADIMLLEELSYEREEIRKFMDEELAYYKLGKYISLAQCNRQYLHQEGKWYSEQNFLNYAPGTKYEYSNLGAELAARIVEIKSGMSFDQFTQKHLFEPLQMNHTAWFYKDLDSNLVSKIYLPDDWDDPKEAIEHPKYQYMGYPSGDLKTSVHDLSLYLIEMIQGSKGKGKLLQAASYQLLFEPQLTSDFFEERDRSAMNDEYNVGLFWAISQPGFRLHNGGSIGVYSFLYFDPVTESGALAFCNLPDGSFGAIRDAIFDFERRLFK